MTNSRVRTVLQKVVKQASQSKTDDSTLAADNELLMTLPIGTYQVTFKLFFQSNATADLKYDISFSGTATGSSNVGAVSGLTPSLTILLDATQTVACTTTIDYLEITVTILVTGAGVLSLKWAQNTSDAGATTIRAGSSMVLI